MNDEIILVDEQDEVTGYAEKMYAHRNRLLHRAFSVFIFDRISGKMLLQKRAPGKYHSGGLWTNACCSHPRRGETMEACLNARLKEELGMETNFHIADPDQTGSLPGGADVIYSCGKFSYFASYGEVCENEIDHVFLYSPESGSGLFQSVNYNKQEIEEVCWVTLEELQVWMEREPGAFTAWFPHALALACETLFRRAGVARPG